MDYSVSKICCKYLTLNRFEIDKTDAGLYLVSSRNQFFMKCQKIAFEVHLKVKGINGVSFVATRIVVCLKYVFQKVCIADVL